MLPLLISTRESPMSMSVEQWIVYVAIAILCAILGRMLTGRSKSGYLLTAVVALVGAFLGAYIARSLEAREPFAVTISGRTIPVLWAIVGATAAAVAVAFLHRRHSRSRA